LRWQLKSLEDVNHQYQISAELSQAEGRKLHSEIHILIWNNEELPQQWNKLINEPVYKKGGMTDCTIIEAYQHISINNYIKNIIEYFSLKVNFNCKKNYWGSSVWILAWQINYCSH
jgi:hypothetical protein